jgi:hypothetical protein
LARAEEYLQEGHTLARESGDKRTVAILLTSQGRLASAKGDLQAAAGFYQKSLALRRDMGVKRGIAESLEELAQLAFSQEQVERAAWLFGAAQVIREVIGAPLPPIDQPEHDRQITEVHSRLGDEAFDLAWVKGKSKVENSWEQAIACALEESIA